MTSGDDNSSQRSNLEPQPAKATDEEAPAGDYEVHRPLVREIDRSLGMTYGAGGGAVGVAMIAVVVAGWWLGAVGSALTWLGVVSVGLVGLLVVRMLVYRRADRLRERLEAYCEANGVEPGRLREVYGREDFYTFFEALFELEERRERLADEPGQAGGDEH